VDQWGYQALTTLTFEADELEAVVQAAAGVRALGDPLLAADVESALRKLAVDLPVDAEMAAPDEPHVLLARARPEAATFESLGDALRRRKCVTFDYHAMSSDRTERREVEPYGLFFLSAHWYLAARDRARGEVRNFRLNRMSALTVNTARAQRPDYEVPATFRLREHARSRQAWELGDGDPVMARVRCLGSSGPTMAALRLGTLAEGDVGDRIFAVRRPDAFARWLLSFAGELVPLAPPEVVAAFDDLLVATSAVYAVPRSTAIEPAVQLVGPTAQGGNAPNGGARERSDAPARKRAAWQPRGAAAQLRRILHVVPQIADGEDHRLDDLAARIGTSVEVLQRDLYSLVARFDAPGGFVEGVQLFMEPDRVSAMSNHLRRPMRLTVPELCALELGLAILRAHRPPDEHAALERARERLRAVIAVLPGDPIPDGLHGASLGSGASTAHLAQVRRALREQCKLRLVYRRSGSDHAGERVVCPYALVASNGMLYLIAFCDQEASVRVFRMDRVEGADATEERFERPADFSVETMLHDGRVFRAEQPATLRVRYSPRVARWIAEREGVPPAPDGTLTIDHPLADEEWAIRHVLQYGPDAEVLMPLAVRQRLGERVEAMRTR
jgi:predicted DNA-binding transcriptional regulator YafY